MNLLRAAEGQVSTELAPAPIPSALRAAVVVKGPFIAKRARSARTALDAPEPGPRRPAGPLRGGPADRRL